MNRSGFSGVHLCCGNAVRTDEGIFPLLLGHTWDGNYIKLCFIFSLSESATSCLVLLRYAKFKNVEVGGWCFNGSKLLVGV